MSTENPGGAAAPAPAASELQPAAGAPPVDGGAADPNAPPAEVSEGEGGQPDSSQAKPQHRTAQYRFSELQRVAKAEAEAAYWRGKAEALQEAGIQPTQPNAAPATPSGPPDPTDRARYPLGDLDPQYMRDMIAHGVREELEAKAKAEREQSVQAQAVERIRAAVEAVSAPGYEDAHAFLHSIPEAHAPFLHDICETSNPPLLSLYLARQSDQARQIAALPQAQRRIVLGEIVGELNARARTRSASPPPPPAAPSSGAGAPNTPTNLAPTPAVSGAGGRPVADPSTMSQAEYERWRSGAVA